MHSYPAGEPLSAAADTSDRSGKAAVLLRAAEKARRGDVPTSQGCNCTGGWTLEMPASERVEFAILHLRPHINHAPGSPEDDTHGSKYMAYPEAVIEQIEFQQSQPGATYTSSKGALNGWYRRVLQTLQKNAERVLYSNAALLPLVPPLTLRWPFRSWSPLCGPCCSASQA